MKRTMTLLAAAVLAAHAAHAQYVTYNHDSPKQNQITVMETGAGSLSPDLYYLLLHNKYKKTAAAKNKLSFRTLAGVNLYNQTDEAEAIDSALVKRAGIEALNIADRQVDLAWLAEGDKVDGQMERFRRNIDRILLCGGTPDERLSRPKAERHRDRKPVERTGSTTHRQRKHPARCHGAVERIPVCRARLTDGGRQQWKRRRRNSGEKLKRKQHGRRKHTVELRHRPSGRRNR